MWRRLGPVNSVQKCTAKLLYAQGRIPNEEKPLSLSKSFRSSLGVAMGTGEQWWPSPTHRGRVGSGMTQTEGALTELALEVEVPNAYSGRLLI